MSSASPDTVAAHPKAQGISRLLDPAFGFFVWALHLLVVYIAAAVACQLGLGDTSDGTRASFQVTLALATVAAAAVASLHALRRHRRQRDEPELRFRMFVTVGADALATVAILWQLLAIGLLPVCA